MLQINRDQHQAEEIRDFEQTQKLLSLQQQKITEGQSQQEQLKALLLQQRELLLKMSNKLNEKDDQIQRLQQEVSRLQKERKDNEETI